MTELYDVNFTNIRTRENSFSAYQPSVDGYKSVSFRAAVIWDQLANIFKQSETLASFKIVIRQWDGKSSHCRICS